ncbi:hemerythrin domain-containing protein [Dactylosporangium sp. NPDC005555]|uniref:hemerythrin domain-containing protein n=1 Tax=Dactylosporangium sp. NPDC005555 TaxID=3154889 RepID=UPI0033A01E3E
MATDAVTLIMNDHRIMEQLFDRLRAGAGDRQLLLDEIAARLTAHSHAEEQRVYPSLPAEMAHHGADEHHEAERMLHDLQRMGPDDESFSTRLDDFIATVGHHIEDEETSVLPALRDAVDPARLVELGAAFEQVRLEELAVAGISVS